MAKKRPEKARQLSEAEAKLAEEQYQDYIRAGMRVVMGRMGWSQREAAHHARVAYRAFNAGVSPDQKNNVSWQIYARFCRASRRDPAEVMRIGRDEVMAEREDRLAELKREKSVELVRQVILDLSPEDRRKVLRDLDDADSHEASK